MRSRQLQFALFSLIMAHSGTVLGQAFGGPGDPSPIEGLLQAQAANPTQREVARFIENLCPVALFGRPVVLSVDLQERCDEIADALTGVFGGPVDLSGGQAGLQNMGVEENSVIGTTEVDASNSQQVGSVRDRLSAVRAGLTGGTSFALTQDPDGPVAPLSGLSAGADYGAWSVFASGNFGFGDKDTTAVESGFDLDTWGLTAGADYRFSDDLVLGGAFGYSQADSDLDNNDGTLETDGYSIMVYWTYYPSDTFYLDGLLGYGANSHDQERNISYTLTSATPIAPTSTETVVQTALSDTDSDEVFASLTGGYSFSRDGGWTWGPYGRLDISHVDIDGYSETMSNPAAEGTGLAVSIADQDFTSIMVALGGQVTKEIPTRWGALYPYVTLEYVHEFDNDSEPIEGRFRDDATQTAFFLPTEKPDRNFGNVGAGITAQFSNGRTAYLVYQGLIGYEGLDVHAIEVGLQIEL